MTRNRSAVASWTHQRGRPGSSTWPARSPPPMRCSRAWESWTSATRSVPAWPFQARPFGLGPVGNSVTTARLPASTTTTLPAPRAAVKTRPRSCAQSTPLASGQPGIVPAWTSASPSMTSMAPLAVCATKIRRLARWTSAWSKPLPRKGGKPTKPTSARPTAIGAPPPASGTMHRARRTWASPVGPSRGRRRHVRGRSRTRWP